MKITAAILLALMIMAVPAQAMTVSANVGPLIKEAQVLIAAKKYKAATAKLNDAEAVKAYPDDEIVINQLRQYLAVASDPTPPLHRCRNGNHKMRWPPSQPGTALSQTVPMPPALAWKATPYGRALHGLVQFRTAPLGHGRHRRMD